MGKGGICPNYIHNEGTPTWRNRVACLDLKSINAPVHSIQFYHLYSNKPRVPWGNSRGCMFFPPYDNHIKWGLLFSQCNLTDRTGLVPQPHITRVPELQGAQACWRPALLRSKDVASSPGGSQTFSWGFSLPHGGAGAQRLWPRGLGGYFWCPAWASSVTQGCVLSSMVPRF